jgi:CRP/FNR family transcriptional regulator/CRP/FNR family cyclic AMP-dependent transcriptional regulator
MGTQLRLDLNAAMELAGKLRDVLPLDILPAADKEELARQMRVRNFKADEVIYHRGDPADQANVVFTGLVKVMLLNEDGHEALVALHGRGEFFGELALFTGSPRDATVIAVMPTTVLQLSRESSWRVLDRNPKAREWMFRHLSENIQKLEEKYESIVFLDVPGRLAKYLLEIDRDGERLPITQDDLAAAVGSTRVTVNKQLADLERRGIVQVERRSVRVLDKASLEKEIAR